MNEKLQYATMLEIPVSTCSITERSGEKKRRTHKKKVNHEQVKKQLMDKINDDVKVINHPVDSYVSKAQILERLNSEERPLEDREDVLPNCEQEYLEQLNAPEEPVSEQEIFVQDGESEVPVKEEKSVTVYSAERKKKFRPRISVIGVQLMVIGFLVATIFLTNALYVDSGINVFLRNVFGVKEVTAVDAREFDEFAPVVAMGDNSGVTVADGVITYSGEGSVYAPCDGVVTGKIFDDAGKFTLEITHSTNFKTVLSGVDIAYVELDDKVYGNIPVGYLNADGATMCFTHGDGTVISNYQIVDGAVVWAV